MTYNEKKFLYESIMKEVAKTVKRRLNENAEYDMKQLSNDRDKAERSGNWDEFNKKYPEYGQEIQQVDSIASKVPGKIQLEILITVDDKRYRFYLKGKSIEDVITKYFTLKQAAVLSIKDAYFDIKVDFNSLYKYYAKEIDEDRIDDMQLKIFNKTSDIKDFANKARKYFGMDFDVK